MNRSFLQIEYSGWWVALLILVAAAISYFLYAKKNVPWTKGQNWLLFSVRFLAIFFILLLLLEPSIKKINNIIVKPTIALAIDNSESILGRGGNALEITNRIDKLRNDLKEQDIEVATYTLDERDTIVFDQRTSRLADLPSKIEKELTEGNLKSIIFFSDGIYNRGASPLYKNYITPIFTVGMGDSIPPKDISISRALYNKVSFKGNETPIRLEITQKGYDGKSSSVTLSENGEKITSQTVRFTSDVQEIEFLLNAEEEGLRHLVATISSDAEESTSVNNQMDIFLEVIDGRQKVLIVAGSPHPDIKAIRSTLTETDNYTIDVYIPSIHDKKPNDIYDVVIFHGAFSSPVNFTPKENPGIWYILNNESAVTLVNRSLPYLKIEKRGGQADKVSGSFNQNFSKFKIEDTEIFEEYPPIEVPFGDYTLTGRSEILMYQKLGNVVTNKPLMVVHDDGSQKSAVLLGQNIWSWKLQEAAINENSIQFQNLITKTIQFLSVKNDKKQFSLDVRSNTFSDSSPIIFDSEVYNDIYERIYGNSIRITITNESGETQNYDFVDSEINSTFQAPNLSKGIYSFKASVKVGDKTLTDNGEFLVENINPEYLNLTANHRLLRNLASKTGGEFVAYDQMDQLPGIMKRQDYKPLVKSEEQVKELIKVWWWYLMIFALFTTEWVLRRYWGGY